MQVLDSAYSLFMEFVLIRCCVEVKITTENFIATFATKDHLDTHGFDFATQEIHWGRCPDCRHIVSLKVVYHIRESVQTFLDGESEIIVFGAEKFGDFNRSLCVRCVGQPNRE